MFVIAKRTGICAYPHIPVLLVVMYKHEDFVYTLIRSLHQLSLLEPALYCDD